MVPVVKNYFSDIPFLNYAESKNEWIINDFSDRGHLNYIGAKKLGKLIEAVTKNTKQVGKYNDKNRYKWIWPNWKSNTQKSR